VNHVTAEEAQDAPGVVLGTFSVNSVPATVLFDSGASHSFITEQFVVKHDIPMSSMKTHLLISSPNGEMKSTYVCPRVNLKIRGIDFQADLVVLTSSGIDVILGMDWLGKCYGIILCAKKSVLLTSPQGDRIEVSATTSSKKEREVNQDEGKQEKKQ
jgi:predicted aspartyl protease